MTNNLVEYLCKYITKNRKTCCFEKRKRKHKL